MTSFCPKSGHQPRQRTIVRASTRAAIHGAQRPKTSVYALKRFCSSPDVCALMEPVLTTLGVIHVPMVAHCLMAALRSHGALGGDDRAIESERSRCLECPKFSEPYCGADVLRKP
ncbi:hypothetical protein CXB51_015169 [Gossypium anomalum]|uniref:Uncharacterized protein n=1 Tax=Gossypium anomalum TaxID=47600 RepID=A0A8J5Z0S2_9ROSI|nr:hypothetical protein CXB51_015169 [Gossypium anomalum]